MANIDMTDGTAVQVDPASLSTLFRITEGMSKTKQDYRVFTENNHAYLDLWHLKDDGSIDKETNWLHNIDGIYRELNTTTGIGNYGADGTEGMGAARVELSYAATLGEFVETYIYVAMDERSDTLILTTSPVQVGGHTGLVGHVTLGTYQQMLDHPIPGNQQFTQTVSNLGNGSLVIGTTKARDSGATYEYGIDYNLTVETRSGSRDGIFFDTTPGGVKQLNLQIFQAISTAVNGVHVYNTEESSYYQGQHIHDIGQLHQTSDGAAFVDGDIAVFTIWGIINKNQECHLCINLPDGVYRVEEEARDDIHSYGNTSFPNMYSRIGFTAYRIAMKWTTANGGTWENISQTEVPYTKWESSNVTSPNYPGTAGHNVDRWYTFTKTGAESITLQFADFNTEGNNYDWVDVYDGNDNLIRRYQGNIVPFQVTVQGDTCKLHYHTDGSVSSRGWKVSWLIWGLTKRAGKMATKLLGTMKG